MGFNNSPFMDALAALEEIDALVAHILVRTNKESPALVFKRIEELKELTAEKIKTMKPANFGNEQQGGTTDA